MRGNSVYSLDKLSIEKQQTLKGMLLIDDAGNEWKPAEVETFTLFDRHSIRPQS